MLLASWGALLATSWILAPSRQHRSPASLSGWQMGAAVPLNRELPTTSKLLIWLPFSSMLFKGMNDRLVFWLEYSETDRRVSEEALEKSCGEYSEYPTSTWMQSCLVLPRVFAIRGNLRWFVVFGSAPAQHQVSESLFWGSEKQMVHLCEREFQFALESQIRKKWLWVGLKDISSSLAK